MKFTRRDFINATGTGIVAAGMPAFGSGMVEAGRGIDRLFSRGTDGAWINRIQTGL